MNGNCRHGPTVLHSPLFRNERLPQENLAFSRLFYDEAEAPLSVLSLASPGNGMLHSRGCCFYSFLLRFRAGEQEDESSGVSEGALSENLEL